MAKKKNSRKALAVALGIMGIAGLSVASASSLTVNPSTAEVGVGVSSFDNCQGSTPITVDYTYDTPVTTASKVTGIKFSGIAAACATKNLSFSLAYTGFAGSPLAPAAHAIVAADATSGYTFDVTSSAIPVTADLGQITIVIK